MAAPIPLRADFDAAKLRHIAKHSRDPDQIRRLLALAAIYDGHARSEAARLAGVGLQIVRDWVMRFNDQGPDGLVNRKAPGQPSRLSDAHRAALAAAIESGPILAGNWKIQPLTGIARPAASAVPAETPRVTVRTNSAKSSDVKRTEWRRKGFMIVPH